MVKSLGVVDWVDHCCPVLVFTKGAIGLFSIHKLMNLDDLCTRNLIYLIPQNPNYSPEFTPNSSIPKMSPFPKLSNSPLLNTQRISLRYLSNLLKSLQFVGTSLLWYMGLHPWNPSFHGAPSIYQYLFNSKYVYLTGLFF